MIKNVIFDMGNVLLSYDPDVCLRLFVEKEEDREIIKRELFNGPEWAEGDLGLLTDEERFDGVSRRVPERLHGELKKCAVDWTICMKPVPGVKEFLSYVKERGYKIFVLSNASNSFYDYFPDFMPLDYFDGTVVSCDIHMVKPDIRIYKYLLEKYGLKAEECFFMDDMAANVEAAKEAGLNGAVFKGDFEEMKELIR